MNRVVNRNMGNRNYDEFFYGHGKLLISGEYFLLSGAEGMALPVSVGQSLGVKYRHSYDPVLHWKSMDCHGNIWFDEKYEFWHFDSVNDKKEISENGKVLQQILREVRKQNKHFLRDEKDVLVDTVVKFPLDWGLGSSSTLIYNIAQWAYIGPFELLFNTFGGSGYDIACAQSDGPILYRNGKSGPSWGPVEFNPSFKNDIYFLHLKCKQSTTEAISFYNKRKKTIPPEKIMAISKITRELVKAGSLAEFDFLLKAHEEIISESLELPRVKNRLFPDYWGEVKSLGAWGGDFAMVTSSKSYKETKIYFGEKGFETLLPYDELVLTPGRESALLQ